MSLAGYNFLEQLSEGGLPDGGQLSELDIESVRKFVEVHFQKDRSALRHIEQLIIESEAKVSRNELRLLLVFYLEVLRQCAVQNTEPTNIYADPTISQFLQQFEHLLTGQSACRLNQMPNNDEKEDQKWVQPLLEELICEMYAEMNRAEEERSGSLFRYDIVKRLISALLANESTRIARRSTMERVAIAVLGMFDAKGSFLLTADESSLLSSLVQNLTRADFFIVVESISRVLAGKSEIWRDGRRMDSQRRTILMKAAQTQRIGPAFAELIAKLCFAASIDPSISDIAFKDHHGLALVLAKLAELVAEDTYGRCDLSRKSVFESLASSSEWNLGLIGPFLSTYSALYNTKAELSKFLRLLFPSLIRRDHQPCSDQAISAFVEALLYLDSLLMEMIPVAFKQLIPHLLDPRLSAHNFFCTFCKAVEQNDLDRVILQQLFTDHPNLAVQLIDLVSTALIGHSSNSLSTVSDQFQWERQHSAFELMISCHWIVPNIPNHSALYNFLVRCALNEQNSFLCCPALHILCKHFPCQTVKHWQHIYTQNYDSAEVKFDLLSHIQQSVAKLSNSLVPTGEHSDSDRLAIIKSAGEVLATMELMLEDEDSEQCLQKGVALCSELSDCIPSVNDVIGERRKMAFQCRQEELLRQKQWDLKERQREDLNAMVETLAPVMGIMNVSNGKEAPMNKECY